MPTHHAAGTRSSAAQRARSELGKAVRRGDPPERIEDIRRELAEANLEQYIRRVVNAWPPLTPAQRERLALLLHPGQPNGAGT